MSALREKLIGTAFELFGRNGFHGVGLDRIFDETGCSKQSFYNHFESKDDLVFAVLTHRHKREMEVWQEQLTRLGGREPRAKLYAIFDALEEWMNEPEWKGCIFMTATAEFPNKTDPAHQAAAEHVRDVQELIQYLATLAGADRPGELALQITILIEGVIAYVHSTGDMKAIGRTREMARALLDAALPAPVEQISA